jgi:response regulator RpfG family c-di-GMP phosphodiesterase
MFPSLLIVDDEEDMLDYLERVFRRDYHVLRAQSVDEAIAALDKVDAVDVIITDRRMPRRSGLELLEIAAARMPDTVRVLLTGYAESLINEKISQWALVDAWISKPIDAVALREAVAAAVAKRAHR